MKRILLCIAAILLLAVTTDAQGSGLVVLDYLRLPKDSAEKIQLVEELGEFLLLARQTEVENPLVLPAEQAETLLLLDEIREMFSDDSLATEAYLMGVEALYDKKSYVVQVAYIAEQQGLPMLKACFDFVAHKVESGFLFSSPLKRNTCDWKTETNDYLTFYYQSDKAKTTVNQYVKYILEFDTKLNINRKTDFYLCDECESMVQMLQLVGVRYKADYNGFAWNSISFTMEDKVVTIESQRLSRRQVIDPHDLFHWRASLAIPEGKNHYMVCGAAYVYCGSWGISWEGIQQLFKTRMVYDKNTDWLALYFERYNFGESWENHLLVTQFINALVVQKVEKEQGFSAVMELLRSGDMYTDRAKFFDVLERVAGINGANFNQKVSELVAGL